MLQNQTQLDYFGKEAAKSYLQDNVNLNDSIIKIASDNALNREQINRVVESANTTTYLSLFKTAEDKYIEFPVADAEKVAEALKDTPHDIEYLGDYDMPPEVATAEVDIFPKVEGDLEKEASVNEIERLHFYQKLKYADNQLKEKIASLSGKFSEETSSLYNMVKQAVLEGQSFGHIKYAMNSHLPGKITDKIIEDIEDTLINKDRIRNLDSNVPEKIAGLNEDNSMLKKLSDIHSTFEDFTKTADYLKLVGETLRKGLSSAGRTGKFVLTHPRTTAAASAAGAGTLIGYQVGKAKSNKENSALNKEPENYKMR